MDPVTRPAAEQSGLQYLDARDYRLVVTVDHDGDVTIEHQHGDDATARNDMALLAAQIVDELGPDAVDDHLQALHLAETPHAVDDPRPVVVEPPPAGRFVLACRCGRALSLRQMCRLVIAGAVGGPGSAPAIAPIVCKRCASA